MKIGIKKQALIGFLFCLFCFCDRFFCKLTSKNRRAKVYIRSAFHGIWYATSASLQLRKIPPWQPKWPLALQAADRALKSPLARGRGRLRAKNILYFVIPQNRNKKAVTVIFSKTKCLTSHAGRISSHLKTTVWCVCSLPKPSLKAQAKQRKSADRGKMDYKTIQMKQQLWDVIKKNPKHRS